MMNISDKEANYVMNLVSLFLEDLSPLIIKKGTFFGEPVIEKRVNKIIRNEKGN